MSDKLCPLFQGPCKEHSCRWYVNVQGHHPQTGAQISEWGCAVEWLPVLLIENAKVNRETGAAVESFRNMSAAMAGLTGDNLLKLVRKDSE